ncbi:hypothetical protein R6Q57_001155, partial [Mikania cordata]
DRRQDLPTGILKQVHTRLLFILTRCTRLVQFHKECSYEESYHILGLHQLSDLGVYKKVIESTQQNSSSPLGDTEVNEAQFDQNQEQNQKQNQEKLNLDEGIDNADVSTAKTRVEKDLNFHDDVDTTSKDVSNQFDPNDDHLVTIGMHVNPPEDMEISSNLRRVASEVSVTQSSLICRICEVEIPTIHVEEHSRICVIADRCDLKGLTVNERLYRVAETLERIIDACSPKSADGAVGNPEIGRISSSKILECVHEADAGYVMENLHSLPYMSNESRGTLTPVTCHKASSGGSLTPRSPLLTPRTNQIEVFLSERKTTNEHENWQQIHKLLEIARFVANINTSEYSALEIMLDHLTDLKYAIQDRKVDALVVETFGRRIEKLLQEKYVLLYGQIDDDKIE